MREVRKCAIMQRVCKNLAADENSLQEAKGSS